MLAIQFPPPPSPSLPNSLLNYVIESFLEKVSESLWHGYKQSSKPDLKYKQFGFINCLICSWDGWYRLIMIEYKLRWKMGKRTGRHMTCLAYALIVAKLIFSNSHANLPKSGVGEKCIFFPRIHHHSHQFTYVWCLWSAICHIFVCPLLSRFPLDQALVWSFYSIALRHMCFLIHP